MKVFGYLVLLVSFSAMADEAPTSCEGIELRGYYNVVDQVTRDVVLTRIKRVNPREQRYLFETVKKVGESYAWTGTMREFTFKKVGVSNLSLKSRNDQCEVESFNPTIGNTELWTLESYDEETGNFEAKLVKENSSVQAVFEKQEIPLK